jgi:HD-GYP domain-containing protein (c-di-GMP phosphodiesterase class II)
MEDFRQIPISKVHIGHVYDFDILMKLQDTYRLFAAKGVVLTRIHLSMMSRSETSLFVKEGEWELARSTFEQDIMHELTDPRFDGRQKADFMYSMAMQSIKDAYDSVIPRSIMDYRKDADEQVKLILSDEEVLGHLHRMNVSESSTYHHSLRVGIYATALLLKIMGDRLTRAQIRRISTGFFLHDIGMAGVPMKIMNKPGHLDDLEWQLIQMHPIWGQRRLINEGSLSLEAINIILSHHEHLDGSGYPHKKTRDDIPLYARICSIADAFEALTAQRPYRKPLAPFEALQAMYQDVTHGFDPEIFEAFVKLLGPEAGQ